MGWRQSRVQGCWTSGLASLSEIPRILHCSRVLNRPGSWQRASGVQPETIMSQDRGYGPVSKGSPLPEDRCLSPDLGKGWLAFSPVFAFLWKQD